MSQTAGRFGPYGGRYVAETLVPALNELTDAWEQAWADPTFVDEFEHCLVVEVGRPSAAVLSHAKKILSLPPLSQRDSPEPDP